jgi:hypothetical protein
MSSITNIENNKVTLVTGLWDLGRDKLTEGWSRSYEYYIEKFKDILKAKENMIIFGNSDLRDIVEEIRPKEKTLFIERPLTWFKENEYYNLIQNIRSNPDWYNMSGWLKDSTQAKLEMYNPLVMSKMFLLNDARIFDPFESEHMYWIDAGITNTVHWGYFTHDKVLDKIKKYVNKFSFLCFPYNAEREIHGFEYSKLNEIAQSKVTKVARGGFFGGPKDSISDINTLYYSTLLSTLTEGYMGTEESIFSILCYKHGDIVNYFDIDENGFISTFFENLKNDNVQAKFENNSNGNVPLNNLDINKTALYVITFNSPNQFEKLISSMELYDKDFLNCTKKYLLNNSTKEEIIPKYEELCQKYNFEHIRKNNIGICGGRQFIAEHFDKTDCDYMFFFEDDMFFYPKNEVCRNGFNRYVNNLYKKSLSIIKNENLDFLKLNFTELYGDNSTQWAWYNVPQPIREQHWPHKSKLPVQGLDPNAPKAIYKNIKIYEDIPYALGEIYYCNWPQIVSKTGNKKMFLDTTWAHPYEQTWMSHMFQLTIKNELNGGILLMTPTEHDRFEFYKPEERIES